MIPSAIEHSGDPPTAFVEQLLEQSPFPGIGATVYMVNGVNRPGVFAYQEGMTALDLVTLAGGAAARAGTRHIVSLRMRQGKVVRVGLHPDDPVQPGDIVEVLTTFW